LDKADANDSTLRKDIGRLAPFLGSMLRLANELGLDGLRSGNLPGGSARVQYSWPEHEHGAGGEVMGVAVEDVVGEDHRECTKEKGKQL
jgi:hypothetical protein